MRTILRIVLAAMLATSVASAADYYMRGGATSGDCLTSATACSPSTLAASGLVQPGDRVLVLAHLTAGAEYTVSSIVFRAGSVGLPVVYESSPAEAAVVTGGPLPAHANITFKNFYVNSAVSENGLTINSDNVRIEGNDIAGIDVYVGDNGCSEDRSGGGPAVSGAGITIASGADNAVIHNNRIHGFNDSGVNTPCTATGTVITDNLIRNNFGSCLSWNNTDNPVTFNGNACWNTPNHVLEIGNGCSAHGGVVPANARIDMTGNIIVHGQEAWEGYSGRVVNAINNTWAMLPVTPTCAIEGGGLGFKNKLAEGIPLATGPFTFKNNIYASYRENDRDSAIYAFSSPLTPATVFGGGGNSNYNWAWRVACPAPPLGIGPCTTITTTNYRWYNPGTGVTDIFNLAYWRSNFGFDGNSREGDPNFTNPLLLPSPLTLAEARERMKPLAGSPACTAGEGGTYVGAVPCDTGPPDNTAPNAISDLAVGSCASTQCNLTWTAPGDDGAGPAGSSASSYEVRYNTVAITSGNWAASSLAGGTPPTPGVLGSPQAFTATGLPSGQTLFFSVRSRDEAFNQSAVSNSPSGTTTAGGGGIDCTEAALEAAIAGCVNGTTITFNCAAGTVVQLTASRFNNRALACSNTIIDGENKVTFEMNPQWWDVTPSFCSSGDCDNDNNDIPESCPDVGDSGSDMWAIRIDGANSQVRNMTIRYFMEGFRLQAAGAIADNVIVEWPGDDGVSNYPGYNVIVRNSTFRNSCDKNIQMYGDEALGSASYDFQVINTVVENSTSSLRTTGAGRFYVEGCTFRDNNLPTSLVRTQGPFFNDTDVQNPAAVYWKSNTVTGVNRGVRVSGAVHFISLGGNTFSNNLLRGVNLISNSRGFFQGDTFTNNGGSSSSGNEAAYGGIAVRDNAVVDAGGGSQTLDTVLMSSTGNNTFSGNRSASDPTLDFQNNTATPMSATNNCWGDPDPSDQVFGSVTYSPVNPSCGATTPTTSSSVRGGSCSGCTIR